MTGAGRCPGCGGLFPDLDGPTHAYMLSSPGCWAAYGEVLAREYQDPALFAACHRLTVDAYALQHPGTAGDRRARQSVRLHHAALAAVFEDGWSLAEATALMKRLAGREMPALPAAPVDWSMTVADCRAAAVADHAAIVRRWARVAFDGWAALREPGGG